MKLNKLFLISTLFFLVSCNTANTEDSVFSFSSEDDSSEQEQVHVCIYGDPIYTWNDDHTKVTATRRCLDDNTHIETETVDVDITITLEATCLVDGQRTYTSKSFLNTAFVIQTYVETIPALGHNHSSTFIYADSAHHGHKCDHCDDYIDLESHDYQISNIVYAQDNGTAFPDPGEITYTCSGCGHSYTEPYYHMEGEI